MANPYETAITTLNNASSVRWGMEPEWASERRREQPTADPNSFIDHEATGKTMGSSNFTERNLAAYDADGNLVGRLSILLTDPAPGAFKITVRPDAMRQGWGTRLLDEAERIGIDIVGSIRANSFTPEGRGLLRAWLELPRCPACFRRVDPDGDACPCGNQENPYA